MEHLIIEWFYKRIRRWIPWLPDPETESGKGAIKKSIIGMALSILGFMVALMSLKPEKESDYGFIKGKIKTIEFHEGRDHGNPFLSARFQLESGEKVFKYNFLPRELHMVIMPKIEDSVELGIKKKDISRGKGGYVREIRMEKGKLGGIKEYISANEAIKRYLSPIIFGLIGLATILLTKAWIRKQVNSKPVSRSLV